MMKYSNFIGSVNKLMANFCHLLDHVLINLLKKLLQPGILRRMGFKNCTPWNIGMPIVFKASILYKFLFLGPILCQNPIKQPLQTK